MNPPETPPHPPEDDASLRGCAMIAIGVFFAFVSAIAIMVFTIRCAYEAAGPDAVEQRDR
ncbi:MAG: hypothetical protein K0U16_07135 [Gammaproteobacteria bacterium]|nr:hypothetical protein [Gammaproteobacteria bacterium]